MSDKTWEKDSISFFPCLLLAFSLNACATSSSICQINKIVMHAWSIFIHIKFCRFWKKANWFPFNQFLQRKNRCIFANEICTVFCFFRSIKICTTSTLYGTVTGSFISFKIKSDHLTNLLICVSNMLPYLDFLICCPNETGARGTHKVLTHTWRILPVNKAIQGIYFHGACSSLFYSIEIEDKKQGIAIYPIITETTSNFHDIPL